MDIYIKINSATQGPFTIEQVRQMLAAGQVTLTHQAFIDGQTSWIQLSQIPGLQNTYSFSSSNPEPPKKILQTYKQTPQKPMSNLIEYRRTCQVCGKIWHSLVSRFC